MSELAKRTAAPRADILPGKTIPVAKFGDYGIMEEHYERQHLAAAASAAVSVATTAGPASFIAEQYGDRLIKSATENVGAGMFRYPGLSFWKMSNARSNFPMLLWSLLRHAAPDMTPDKAAAMAPDDQFDKIQRAVLEQFGYSFRQETETTPPNGGAAGTGPSPTSPTTSSGSETTPTTKSPE